MIRIFSTSLISLGLCGAASAATILSSNFTGVTTDGAADTATLTGWDTVTGINPPSTTLNFAGNNEHGGADLLFFAAPDLISVDYNLSNEGSYEYTIGSVSLDAGTSEIDLTSLSMVLNGTSNSGGAQAAARTLELTVEVVGSVSGSLGSSSFSASEPSGGTGTTYTVNLGGLASLTAGETYDFIVNVDDVGAPGVNASMDDLIILGEITPIPEPGNLALLGLAGSMVLLRRRQ